LQERRNFDTRSAVTRRYEIQEMLAQDAHGVVFQAVDRQSGDDVVLRRFFPFGPEGGGLEGEERTAYMVAVERLKGVSHPALRNILDGGCDPVDGMPYLVTEWVEGTRLAEHLKEKALSPGSVRALLDQALEVSQVLAGVLGEEAVWVETATEAVILSEGEQGRGITFWISPLRWLGDSGERKGLAPLVELGEASLHWQGRVFSEQSGEGLGAWFKAIKADPGRWTLEEARATLHAAQALVGEARPAPGRASAGAPTVVMPHRPAAPKVLQPPPSRLPWIFSGLLMLATTGLVAWKKWGPAPRAAAVAQAASKPASPTPAPAPAPPTSKAGGLVFSVLPAPIGSAASAAQRASARAAELASGAAQAAANPAVVDSAEVHALLVACGKQLRGHLGQQAELTGIVYQARVSDNKRFRYLDFGSSADPDAVRIRNRATPGDKRMYMDQLKKLRGSKITVKGSVAVDADGRIVIDVAKRSQITVIAP
jgi:hypothetical protein